MKRTEGNDNEEKGAAAHSHCPAVSGVSVASKMNDLQNKLHWWP